jgi:hypothetical protein
MAEEEGIVFCAILQRISTDVSGGWTVGFTLPQSEVEQIKKLSHFREAVLTVAVIPRDKEKSKWGVDISENS